MRNNKCYSGVLCVKNVTIIIFAIVCFAVGYLYYKSMPNQLVITNEDIKNKLSVKPNQININNYSDYATMYDDSHIPPFRNDGYSFSQINVSTNISAVETSFRQFGILTPISQTSKDNILPLMGRILFTNRNKFQYYTISNQNNQVKLPISVKGKSGLDEYGVDEVFDGDNVYVEGYEDVFKVTKYDNGTMKYLPYI